MIGSHVWRLIVTFLVVCGAAVSARAQAPATAPPPAAAQNGPHIDVSAGYLWSLSEGLSMHGWNVQLSVPIARRWSLVGEFDASRGSYPGNDYQTYRDLAGLAGVRYRGQPTDRISPFWQVLAGGLKFSREVDYFDFPGRRVQYEYTTNYFVFQPGAGVTVMVTRRFGIQTQGDFQFYADEAGGSFDDIGLRPRVTVGGVVRLGR